MMTNARYSMLMMIAFGASWVVVERVTFHLSQSYSPFQLVWTRYAVHLGFMVAVWGWRKPLCLVATRRPVFQLARSALMLSMPLSFIFGLGHGLNPSAVMAIFWICPLLIVACATIVLHERVSFVAWLAAAIAAVGGALALAPTQLPAARAFFWPLGMAVSFSLYIVMTRSLRTETTRANLFYTALGVFIALTPLMPFVWVMPTRHDLVLLTAIGLVGYLGLYCIDRLAAAAPVSTSAPLAPAQAAIGLGAGAVFSHFLPSTAAVAGVVLIAAAGLMTWWCTPELSVQAL